MEKETLLKLIVRTPNQQIQDISVDCSDSWTIGQLKNHLSEVYPYKPDAEKQKIIYRGQLLGNTVFLRDIFKRCDENNGSFTIHLICNTIESVKKSQSPNSTLASPRAIPEISHARQDLSANLTPNSQTQLIHYTYGQLNDGQAAWFQQAYMQYWTNYMQLMASQGLTPPYITPINLPMSENPENLVANNEHLQRPPVQNNAEIINNINNNNNNNNNFGVEDGANRDWVDNVYMLSRIIVLFSIVYFYSSPLRFAAVTLLGFLLYLYKARFFRTYLQFPDNNNVRVENNNQILANDNNNPGEPDQRPDVIERRARLEEANETNESDNPAMTQTNNNNENEVQRPGLLSFTWIFFSSFFASLIPDVADVM